MLKPLPIRQPKPLPRAGNRPVVGRNNGQDNDCENSNPRQSAGNYPIVIDQPVHDGWRLYEIQSGSIGGTFGRLIAYPIEAIMTNAVARPSCGGGFLQSAVS